MEFKKSKEIVKEKKETKEKGDKTMKKMQKLLMAALALVTVGMLVNGYAASTDTILLTVNPGVTYSVRITSATNYTGTAYNFGTVDLNRTTRSETKALVENIGNVTSKWQVSAYQDGGTWSLGTSTSADTAVLKALFNSENGVVPTDADYNTLSGSTITNSGKIAASGNLSTSNIVNTIPVNGKRDLYFMLHTPDSSGSGNTQNFRVYVTAVP